MNRMASPVLLVLGLVPLLLPNGLCREDVFAADPRKQSRNLQTSSDGWQEGRATFYGDGEQDNASGYKGTTIHQGSCMFGQLDPNVGTGWDIAALSDHNYDFNGSCGHCYEVRCRASTFSDGSGEVLNRQNACYDQNKAVIVRITDACPCDYKANAASNKRWCCGDMYTMDLSYVAFDKLASRSVGVIGIKYRRVECPAGTPQPTPQQSGRNQAFDRSTY